VRENALCISSGLSEGAGQIGRSKTHCTSPIEGYPLEKNKLFLRGFASSGAQIAHRSGISYV
jgi:hypothetical protein